MPPYERRFRRLYHMARVPIASPATITDTQSRSARAGIRVTASTAIKTRIVNLRDRTPNPPKPS